MIKVFPILICLLSSSLLSILNEEKPPADRINQDKLTAISKDTALASEHLQKGMSFFQQQQFDSGAYYFELGSDIYQQYGLWEEYIRTGAHLTLNLIYLDKIDSASQINQNLIKIFKQKQLNDTLTYKRLLNYQGGIYSITKKLDSAIIITKKLLALDKLYYKGKPDMRIGGTYHNLGTLYTDYEMLDMALQYYDSAETIYYQLNAKESEEAARLYSNKAIVLKLLGDYEGSITFNERSYEIFRSVLKPEHPRLALALFNIGHDLIDRNKNKQDNLDGIHYLNRGFEVLENGGNLSHRYIPDYYRFIAKAYINLEEFDLATRHLKKALAKSIEINEEGHVEQAYIYEELGKICIDNQFYDLAQEYLNKSKNIYENEISSDFKRIANIYDLEGFLLTKQRRYDNALKHYQTALSYFISEIDTNDVLKNPDDEMLVTHENLFRILRNKAESLNKAYKENQELTYLEAAFETYLLLNKYVQNSRNNFFNRSAKLEFTEEKGSFYEDGIETGLILYQKTQRQEVLESTFQLADHYKSFLLLEELEHNKAKMFANLPQSLINKEQELKGAINYTQQQLFEKKKAGNDVNEESVKALETKLFILRNDFELLVKTIEQEYPSYHQLKYHHEVLDISKLSKMVKKDAITLLQYFVGDQNIYMWLLDKNELSYVKIPKPDQLEVEIKKYLNDLNNHNFSEYVRRGHTLYQTLFEPVVKKTEKGGSEIEHIVIIPDGVLGYLPFETLITQDPQSNEGYKDLSYLIKDHNISYHYSASLLASERPHKPRPKSTFIGFAPSFSDNTDQQLMTFNQTVRSYMDSVKSLPYAEEEVNFIASLLGGIANLGPQATEHNFKHNVADYRIIHLASHSLVDDEDPLYSKLIFDSEHDSIEDGLLHTYELYNMQLNADLVCLSACNTGVGKYYKGEGIVSLARGFMYAGVPNVMMSLWPATDRPTKDIMTYFYEALNEGVPYAKSLREAKLRYLENADDITANPYYWGTFIYLGEASEDARLEKGKALQLTGAIMLIVLLVTGGYFYYKRRSS